MDINTLQMIIASIYTPICGWSASPIQYSIFFKSTEIKNGSKVNL